MKHLSLMLGGLCGACATLLTAQSALDCTPPLAKGFVPEVFVHDEIPPEAAGPKPIAVAIDANGRSWGTRIAANGDPLPALHTDDAATWQPARNHETAVPGALWLAPPCAFHFELDAAEVIPPKPRFLIDRVAAGKFEIVCGILEKGILKIELLIDADGDLKEIKAWDKRLTDFARDLFKAILPPNGPAFEPARNRATGKPVAVRGELRWDLSGNAQVGKSWITDTIGWEHLQGPAANFDLIVIANGHGGVQSTYLDDSAQSKHPDLHDVLLSALIMPLVSEKADTIERWTLRLNPTDGTLRKISAHPVSKIDPVMLFAPRPEYPKSLWRRGPRGYVYVRYRIRSDGAVDQIRILETTEKEFAAAAINALEQWKFEPMTFDGLPIASEVIMTLHFRLPR